MSKAPLLETEFLERPKVASGLPIPQNTSGRGPRASLHKLLIRPDLRTLQSVVGRASVTQLVEIRTAETGRLAALMEQRFVAVEKDTKQRVAGLLELM